MVADVPVTVAWIEEILDKDDPEGLTTELKGGLPSTGDEKKKIGKTVAAFANCEGGVIVIGAADKKDSDGQRVVHDVCPRDAIDDELLRLGNSLRDKLDPEPGFELRAVYLPTHQATVFVIQVPSYLDDDTLYFYDGKPYMRRADGQSTRMGAGEVRRFFHNRLRDKLRKAEQRREDRLRGAEEGVLANIAVHLWSGEILTQNQFQHFLRERAEDDQELYETLEERISESPLLRWHENGHVEFPDEDVRGYYVAKELATLSDEELGDLLGDPASGAILGHLFSVLTETQTVVQLTRQLIDGGHVLEVIDCINARNRAVVDLWGIEHKLMDTVIPILRVDEALQLSVVSSLAYDPWFELRRQVMRCISVRNFPNIPIDQLIRVLLDGIDDVQSAVREEASRSLYELLGGIEEIKPHQWFRIEESLLATLQKPRLVSRLESNVRLTLVEILGCHSNSAVALVRLKELLGTLRNSLEEFELKEEEPVFQDAMNRIEQRVDTQPAPGGEE